MGTDEMSREALRAFDPAGCGGLSEADRDRIALAVAQQGPFVIRRARQMRTLRQGVVVGTLAAAAAMLVVMRAEPELEPVEPVAAVSVPLACEADAVASYSPIREDEEGQLHVEIGNRARAVAPAGTILALAEATPCNTRFSLQEGELTVHAQDLGGGTLTVDTPHGSVLVKGTLFRVASLAASTSVAVAHGEVVVTRRERPATHVKGGQAVTVDDSVVTRSVLSQAEREALDTAFIHTGERGAMVLEPESELDPVQPKRAKAVRNGRKRPVTARRAPEVTAEVSLAEAEELWRKGDRTAARTAFRKAGEASGPTGEAAWLRLARLELSSGSPARALAALQEQKQRGRARLLGAEAMWLEVQALDRAGREREAVERAAELVRSHPSSPQAKAAKRRLQEQDAP